MKKKIIGLLILVPLFVTSCFEDPGTDIVWGDEAYLELDRAGAASPISTTLFTRLNDGIPKSYSVQVNLMGKPRTAATTANFEIEATSTAIEGVHYNKLTPGNSVTIAAGENTATINFEVLADNIDPGEIWTIIISLTGGDVPLSKYVRATFRIQISCPSDLAGTYSYTTTNVLRGTTGVPIAACNGITGDGTLGVVSAGVYSISDASFGHFACVWGDSPVTGVRLNDICEELAFTGVDQYGDSYSIDIVSNDGTNLVFDWENTYGDAARTTLTRTDGKTWPAGLNTD